MNTEFDASSLVAWGTPFVVPLVLAGLKKLAPSLPSWSIPLMAPVLGVAIELLGRLAGDHASNVVVAALLGLAGVGLREAKDQLLPAPNGGWPQPTP